MTHDRLRRAVAAALAAGMLALAGGCGDKIAIPQPQGLFSLTPYVTASVYESGAIRQLIQSNGFVFVVEPTAVRKLNQEFTAVASAATGLVDATALCVGPNRQVVFAWDQGTRSLHWYASSDLSPLGQAELAGVQSVRAMAANDRGIEQVPGARTYLYLADPDSGVVHRYAFDDFNGPSTHGILAWAPGEGARSVHQAAGMATDAEGMFLVCDTDPDRNWVIRFDATPDLSDTTPAIGDEDPLRGLVREFEITCEPPAMTDYVIGYAAACTSDTLWVGRPGSARGEFDRPHSVDVDGSGRIFVADTGNNRVQVFDPRGQYLLQFGTEATCPEPSSLAVIDVRVDAGPAGVHYGAFVFALTPGSGQVQKFISSQHYIHIHRAPPPQD
jgi:hypothetical protein